MMLLNLRWGDQVYVFSEKKPKVYESDKLTLETWAITRSITNGEHDLVQYSYENYFTLMDVLFMQGRLSSVA
jgi:hypothetical protein